MNLDPNVARDAHAIALLERDMIGWLTTVTAAGQPQTMPVWFLWTDGQILIYGDHRARRNANLVLNPRVSLHLGDDGSGGDVLVIEGTARIELDLPPVPEHAAYLAKYGAWIDTGLGGAEQMAHTYSMPIVVTPARYVVIP